MIEVDFKKEMPFRKDFHKGMTDSEIEDLVKAFKIDPAKDQDLRFWFLLQKFFQVYSAEGRFENQIRYLLQEDHTVGEMWKHYKIDEREIKKSYVIPREQWDLTSIAGNYYKLWKNMQRIGFECLKDYKPGSKTAITRSCTARKPYNITSKQYKLVEDYDADLLVWSYNMVPLAYINEYPFAFYIGVMGDAEGYAKSGELTVKTFEEFFNKFHYDRIIDICRPGSNRKQFSVPYLNEHGWTIEDVRPKEPMGMAIINFYGVADNWLPPLLEKRNKPFSLNRKIIH